jgi:serine/threonine protein kinase
METFYMTGNFTADQVIEALRRSFPEKKVSFLETKKENRENRASINHSNNNEILVARSDNSYSQLLAIFDEKDKQLKESETAALKVASSVQELHQQQNALYQEFAMLRGRYDDQKASIVNILWNECAKFHPELREIPPIEDKTTFIETEDQVGQYTIGDILGEGQFAAVRSCILPGRATEYAIKIIKKEKITSFKSLTRVSNEIDNLKSLRSDHIITLVQVIHTQSHLYLITEKGGTDLFDFFGEHAEGVPESWAREIISNVLKGVLFCHSQEICHRDLKPENILLTFDHNTGKCIDLKLCDFGLSARFKPKQVFSDFCGSPGFFAPEMIIHGCYFGDKADVWSVGCILLELICGHEKFCDLWMTAYDYGVLQDKEVFTETISETVDQLPDFLNFSENLNDFVKKFLELKSSKRPNAKQIARHPWLEGVCDSAIESLFIQTGTPLSPLTSGLMLGLSPKSSFLVEMSEVSGKDGFVPKEEIQAAYNNISERERKQLEEFNKHYRDENKDGEEAISLPPITPATPSITKAKKILRKGSELANTNYIGAQSNLSKSNNLFSSPSNSAKSTLSISPNPLGTIELRSNSVNLLSPAGRSPLPSVSEHLDDFGFTESETLLLSQSDSKITQINYKQGFKSD